MSIAVDEFIAGCEPVYIGKRRKRADGTEYIEASNECIEAIRRAEEQYAKVWPYNEREKREHPKKGLRAFLASLFA